MPALQAMTEVVALVTGEMLPAVRPHAYGDREMQQLVGEAERMPETSVRFARGISQVWTPEHLVPLRQRVRTQHAGQLGQVHAAIDRRFGTTGATDDYVNVFYAAAEMAVMELVGREELSPADRRLLRQLWEDLLAA